MNASRREMWVMSLFLTVIVLVFGALLWRVFDLKYYQRETFQERSQGQLSEEVALRYVRYSHNDAIAYGVLNGEVIEELAGLPFDAPEPTGRAVETNPSTTARRIAALRSESSAVSPAIVKSSIPTQAVLADTGGKNGRQG